MIALLTPRSRFAAPATVRAAERSLQPPARRGESICSVDHAWRLWCAREVGQRRSGSRSVRPLRAEFFGVRTQKLGVTPQMAAHEHGGTDVVSTIVLERGEQRDVTVQLAGGLFDRETFDGTRAL
jgi:hypothetical protein